MRFLFEGTKYDKKASKVISDSGLFTQDVADNIIDALFREDIHAFVHSPNWLEKYLIGIARMMVEEANGDKNKAIEFLSGCGTVFDEYLTWVKQNREKMGGVALDNKFNNQMSYQDVKDELERIQEERDKESAEELAKMKFNTTNFELIPIDSYEQMHEMFGGRATGDGSSDKYAGGGGTAWCHTNSDRVYKSSGWEDGGANKFYVLANKNWKNIPFDPKSNEENYADDYGNSLIAILVNKKKGRLKKATLRCNHVWTGHSGVPEADNVYKTYAELSKVAGFNVEDAVLNDLGIQKEDLDNGKILKIKAGVPYEEWRLDSEDKEIVEKIIFEDGRTSIPAYSFSGCILLKEVVLPSTLEEIQSAAFDRCESLERITIPASVTEIGTDAFQQDRNLKEVVFEQGTEKLELGAYCFFNTGITSITIPPRVKYVSNHMVANCVNLEQVIIEDGVESISDYAFSRCPSLKKLVIPKSVKRVGDYVLGEDLGYTQYDVNPKILTIDVSSRSAGVSLIDFYGSELTKDATINKSGIEPIKDVFVYKGTGAKDYLFEDELMSIKSARIDSSVMESGDIGAYAFANMTSLVDVELPYGIEFIGTGAFADCFSLKTLTLPRSIRTIAPYAFCGTDLEYIDIPEGVQVIDEDTFMECKNLESVEIPNTVTVISYDAFRESGIKKVAIPNSVKSVLYGAFTDCKNLEYVSIPQGCLVNRDAFEGCTNIKAIVCHDETNATMLEREGFNVIRR